MTDRQQDGHLSSALAESRAGKKEARNKAQTNRTARENGNYSSVDAIKVRKKNL